MTSKTNVGAKLARAHAGRFRVVPYAELRQKANELAVQILERYGREPGGIVVAPILLGGGLPARLVVDSLLGSDMVRAVVPCHIKRYIGVGQAGEAEVLLALPRKWVKGRVVVGVDDLADGGQTLTAFRAHALAQGARAVDTAVIYTKPQSKAPAGLSAEQGVTQWLVLPGEELDFMDELKRVDPELVHMTPAELRAYFEGLGFPAETVRGWLELQQAVARCTMGSPDYAKTK